MRTAVLLVAAACAPGSSSPVAPEPRKMVTPLEVVVLDDFTMENTCDGVAPRRFHVALDGVVRGIAVVPCRTVPVSPPKQFPVPVFAVPPGMHTLTVREPETETTAELRIRFPVFDPPLGEADDDAQRELATKLPVWANEHELQIHAPLTQLAL